MTALRRFFTSDAALFLAVCPVGLALGYLIPIFHA